MDRSKTIIVPILWHDCNNGAVYMIPLSRDGIQFRMIFMNYNKSPGLATPPVKKLMLARKHALYPWRRVQRPSQSRSRKTVR